MSRAKRDAARQFILEQFKLGEQPTLREIADEVSCSIRTASNARDELISEHLIDPLPHTPSQYVASPALPQGEPTPIDPRDLSADRAKEMLERALSGQTVPLTLDQHRALLAEMATTGSDQIRIRAQEADLKFISAAGTGKDVGRATPLTEEEVVFETSMILAAAGEELAAQAWAVAFGPRPEPNGRH